MEVQGKRSIAMGIKLQSGSGDLKNNDIKSYILSSIQIPLWNKYLKPILD
jgi:hypothetical protein